MKNDALLNEMIAEMAMVKKIADCSDDEAMQIMAYINEYRAKAEMEACKSLKYSHAINEQYAAQYVGYRRIRREMELEDLDFDIVFPDLTESAIPEDVKEWFKDQNLYKLIDAITKTIKKDK